MRKNNRYWLSI